MKRISTTLFFLLGLTLNIVAENWISRLPDHIFISQLSIPGTHDAATGNGVQLAMFAQCQDVSVDKQWEAGIRAFDLRPIVKKDHLHINHGIAETDLRFDDALFLLRDSLIANPNEFVVIHTLYANNYNEDKDTYVTMLDELLGREDLKDYLVDFRRDLTLGDVRGKMLILSREAYANLPITGGFLQSWCGHVDWTAQTSCYITGPGTGADNRSKLYVQDFSNTKEDDGGITKKIDAVKKMLDFSTKHTTKDKTAVTWVFNFASSYPGSISTANGYRGNAAETNTAIIEYLQTHPAGPTGVILMDYACVDESNNHKTRGQELTDSIIANNFKWLERINKEIYDEQMTRIERLYQRWEDIKALLETDCADVAAEFTDRLAAAKDSIDAMQQEADSLYSNLLLTDGYKGNYTKVLLQLSRLSTDIKEAQEEFDNQTDISATTKPEKKIAQVYSISGQAVDKARQGAIYLVEYTDGTVGKLRL